MLFKSQDVVYWPFFFFFCGLGSFFAFVINYNLQINPYDDTIIFFGRWGGRNAFWTPLSFSLSSDVVRLRKKVKQLKDDKFQVYFLLLPGNSFAEYVLDQPKPLRASLIDFDADDRDYTIGPNSIFWFGDGIRLR